MVITLNYNTVTKCVDVSLILLVHQVLSAGTNLIHNVRGVAKQRDQLGMNEQNLQCDLLNVYKFPFNSLVYIISVLDSKFNGLFQFISIHPLWRTNNQLPPKTSY